MVYKPLDGRPWANADCHCPTLEAEMLEECSDLSLFPKNWRIETHNGRRFLVRKKAYIYRTEEDYRSLSKSDVIEIEASIREANRRGWEINDPIVIGYLDGHHFIVDLSSCQRMTGKCAFAADEEWRIFRFFEMCGYNRLVMLRRNGSSLVDPLRRLDRDKMDHRHVYASFNRPLSLVWASLPGDPVLEHNDRMNWKTMQPYTWIITDEPLSDDICYRYELTWAWSPIR